MNIKKFAATLLSGAILAVSLAVGASAVSSGDLENGLVLFEGEASCASWGQAVELSTIKNDGGTFDPAVFDYNNLTVTVDYTGSVPEVVLQSWSGGAGWAKVAPTEDNGSSATFTYDKMVEAYGSADLSTLDKFIVGATDDSITINKVTLAIEKSAEQATEIVPVTESADASESVAETTTVAETGNTDTAVKSDKASADTGIADVGIIVGAAVLAAGTIMVVRKKNVSK